MHASRPTFPTRPRVWAPLAWVAGCGLLAGCMGSPFGETRIDPASPVAADVARLTRGEQRFPTFASIPNPPDDIRPLREYGESAQAVLAAGEDLMAATAPSTWTLQDTDAFAERAREDAGPEYEGRDPGDAEAFARELRERATPPPPR